MRKQLRALVAVVSVLVAVLSIVMFVYRLGDARTSGERSSGAEYSIFRNSLMSIQSVEDLKDPLLREKMIALYKGSDRLLAAQVLDSSGLVVWKLPAQSSYFALPSDAAARSGFSAPDWSTVIFTTPLSDGIKLSALYATVRRSDISQAAKVPAIVAALWCLAVALAIVLLSGDKVEAAEKAGASADADAGADAGAGAAESAEAEIDNEDEAAPETAPEAADSSADESASESEDEAAQQEAVALAHMSADSAGEESPEFDPEAAGPEAAEEDLQGQPEEAFERENEADDAAARGAKPPRGQEAPQSIAQAVRSGRNFEESLARLEEEIVQWNNRHPDQTPRPADSGRQEGEIRGAARPANGGQPPAAAGSQPDALDEEIDEELDELEAAPEEEPAEDEETTLADSRETLQEFEELNAETQAAGEAAPSGTSGASGRAQPPAAAENPAESKSAAPGKAAGERQNLASLPMPLALADSGLEARLSEELARGPRNDVSLMLIHCAVSSRADPAAVALSVTVRDYIGSKDLIFELYKGAFAVVLPSVDLGGALKMSEDLADILSTTLGLYKDIEGEAPVYIGISARSDRDADAGRIYREASTAVHKAYSGGRSRILAFRPKAD